ncbi:MAG: leucine-rich repeat protein [Lachnospiraceae bacterium]|nr:leucine-rich repeat protein [Lachnospiraceae bacterium]
MAKIAKKKKKNYRLRKSVRRTLGALFMMSAIIVAAIPFPDAAATEEIPESGTTNPGINDDPLPSDLGVKYIYNPKTEEQIDALDDIFSTPVGEGADADDITSETHFIPKDSDKDASGNYYGAYFLRTTSSKEKMLIRQFDFIQREFDMSQYGVIVEYFDTFSEEVIELDPAIVTGYETESISAVEDFYLVGGAGTEAITYDLSADQTTLEQQKAKNFFSQFYPEMLKTYTNNYNAGSTTEALSIVPAADQNLDRGRVYCWLNDEYDFTLERVIDKSTRASASTNGSDTYIYVKKFVGPAENADKYVLEDGYKVLDRATIIAIGENAFKGVKKVKQITFPDDIQYIANKAFKDSFIDKFIIQGASAIGHAAFAGCTDLVEVSIPNVTVLGVDAFYGCLNLGKVEFNTQTTEIMDGAFAGCYGLNNVDLSKISSGCNIGEGAFFDCGLGQLTIGTANIISLGKGSFAMNSSGDDNLTELDFTNARIEKIGDYAFSGREYLTKVCMSKTYGDENSAATLNDRTLPSTIFYGCRNLELLVFPENCGYVLYNTTQYPDGEASSIFNHILNESFAVQGPAMAGSEKAKQRELTWYCRNGKKAYVPYMYQENGKIYYEVKSGIYLLGLEIDKASQTATIARCEYVDPDVTGNGKLDIPSKVGPYVITKFGDGCFDDVKDEFTEITVPDNTITEIGAEVFKGCDSITTVTLGDSVKTIGKSAFEDCSSLTSVTIGKNISKLGDSAFKNCILLTDIKFETPDNADNFPLGNIGKDALATGSNKLTITGTLKENYGPFAYSMDPQNYVNSKLGIRICYKTTEPSRLTVILDNRNNYPTLVDYPKYDDLNDVKVYELDAEGNETENKIGLLDKFNREDQSLSPAEEAIINSTLIVDIPAGIKSIDVRGYLTDSSLLTLEDSGQIVSNSASRKVYFENNSDYKYYDTYKKYGLFNGDINDSAEEDDVRGDDNLIGIKMYTVEYLPTISNDDLEVLGEDEYTGGAFYNCENLQNVDLGSAMKDVGTLPFLDCLSLKVDGVDASKTANFEAQNGILYENVAGYIDADGNSVNGKKIIEVFHSRGIDGDADVNATKDPKLTEVVEIAPGAFMNTNIGSVDLTGTPKALSVIPENCFKDSEGLVETILPENIRIIKDGAFENTGENTNVVIKGKEVDIQNEAFKGNKAIVRTYKNTAAYNAAEDIPGVTVKALDDTFRVVFYNSITGDIIKTEYVEDGEAAREPYGDELPQNPGMKFKGWNTDEFKKVTKDLTVLALYEPDETAGDGTGSNPGGNTPGTNVNGGIDTDGDGKPDVDANGNKLYNLTVTSGSGSGRYAAGTVVTINAGAAPNGTGFANWSSTNNNVIFKDSTKPTTTLTMPAEDTTVVCNFTGYYRLDVVYGSGSGSYPAGAKVTIEAVDAPQGRSFASWRSSTTDLEIENTRKQITTVTMPKSNAKVTATYMDNGTLSGNSTSNNNTSIIITKPGISNTHTASAYVSGSSDNFIVKISESLEATEEVQKALQKKYPDMSRIKYFAMDISLYDAKGINKITDTTGLKVNITMPIPDALKEYAGNNRVGAVVNGELETLNPKFTTINGVPSITFTATHFSPYTIYVDTGNLTVSNTLDSTPKTGDGIHPKWFLSIGLACISIILFTKRDRRYTAKAYR